MGELGDKIKAKVAAKTAGIKDRIKNKVQGKVAAKCGKCGRACVALALLAMLAGCHMGELPTSQPTAQRAQTSTITGNTFVNNFFTPTNALYDAEGNPVAAVRIEIGNLTQANETSGTESQTATQTASPSNTPTVSVPVRIDARYNDAIKGATDASKDVLAELTDKGKEAVLKLMADKSTGTVEVQKTDGTTATVECKDGQCSFCENDAEK